MIKRFQLGLFAFVLFALAAVPVTFAADRESVSGQDYLTLIRSSTGSNFVDCFHFYSDGTFMSDVGLVGTWDERGVRWMADALFGGEEEHAIQGLSLGGLLLGNGTSITNDYTYNIVGLAGFCSAEDVAEHNSATYSP